MHRFETKPVTFVITIKTLMQKENSPSNNLKTLGFLPDLCVPKSVLRLLLVTQVLAVVLALASTNEVSQLLPKLGKVSLFVLWTAGLSVLVICLIGRFLKRNHALTSTLIIVIVTALFAFLGSLIGMAWEQNNWQALSFGQDEVLYIIRNVVICTVITLLALRYFYIQFEWEKSLKADSSARYTALQSRMRPHFLFNSLNTIAQLTTVNPERAEDAILDLADIFRSTLDTRERVTLGEELDITTRYLRMEGLRLGKRRLNIAWDMERNTLPFDMPIPPLLLQPLVENAIYHGIQPRKDGGTLGISLYDAGDHLVVSVSNPIPPTGTNSHQKGNHIAQENLKNRLKIAYGDKANLKITKAAEQYRVSFTLPKE